MNKDLKCPKCGNIKIREGGGFARTKREGEPSQPPFYAPHYCPECDCEWMSIETTICPKCMSENITAGIRLEDLDKPGIRIETATCHDCGHQWESELPENIK